jgi:hypothetical protein
VHRLWAERGDFSKVTVASIEAGHHQDQAVPADAIHDTEKKESYTPEELWALKQEIVSGLTCAFLVSLCPFMIPDANDFPATRASAPSMLAI